MATTNQSTIDTRIAVQKALDQTRRRFQRQTQALKDTEQLIVALEYQLDQLLK